MSWKSRRKATLSHNRFHFSCKARTDVSVEEPTRDVCSRGSDGLLSLHKWQAWRFLLIAVAARTHILQASASRPKMWRQFMWRHVDKAGLYLFKLPEHLDESEATSCRGFFCPTLVCKMLYSIFTQSAEQNGVICWQEEMWAGMHDYL